jgi:hypothetical protein
MIVLVPALNDNDTPNAVVDDDVIAVATIPSAVSRNAALPLSTWMAAQRTSSADTNPSLLPWPSLHISPSQGGSSSSWSYAPFVVVVVVVIPLHCDPI